MRFGLRMKNCGAFFSALVILTVPGQCSAGVVLDEQQVISQPGSRDIIIYRSIFIEGSQEKSVIDNGKRLIITDLGSGIKIVIDTTRKTYMEFPFPSKRGPTGAVALSAIGFKRTGAHDKIIGYSCEVYSGSKNVGDKTVSVRGCFSETAPGASEYMNFQREMSNKAHGAAISDDSSGTPAGIPLVLSVTSIPNLPRAAISLERASKLKQILAHQQLVTTTTISKITTTTLPAESFQVSPGYQKQQFPQEATHTSGQPPTSPSPPPKLQ